MLNRYRKLKGGTYVNWVKQRLDQVRTRRRDKAERSPKEMQDIYPRPLLISLAVIASMLAILCAYAAMDAWQAANWIQLLIVAPGAVFFVWCAVAWWRKWRAKVAT